MEEAKPCRHGMFSNRICEICAEADPLIAVLRRYMSAYPAFRMKPIGAPGSPARIEQENLMALEETAKAAIERATK